MSDAAPQMPATLALADAAARRWDVLVVGAGPAGALAARGAARAGLSLLLVDRARFPRSKVCGGCLNAAALETLRQCGLGDLPLRLGGRPLAKFRLAANGGSAELPLPGGVAVSRARFDAALAEQAVACGAHFLPGVSAVLRPIENAGGHNRRPRNVELRCNGSAVMAAARVVVAADGLNGGLLNGDPSFRLHVAPAARIGAATILDAEAIGTDVYAAGTIHMACGRHGYVGLVRFEDDRLNVAAALDPSFVRRSGSPGAAANAILHAAGLVPLPGLLTQRWKGTPVLTRRRTPPAADRVFLVGDAAGYVEPFTGEGMAWALASAAALPLLLLDTVDRWRPAQPAAWAQCLQALAGRRRACRAVTRLLRVPRVARLSVRLLGQMPWLARPYVRYVNARARSEPRLVLRHA